MMRQIHLFMAFLVSVVAVTSCRRHFESVRLTNKDISDVLNQMTDLMVDDVTNPPLAARFFSYACLAGYEVVCENNNKFKSLHGVLQNYPVLNKMDSIHNYS